MKYELEILTRIIEGEASSDEVKTFIRALELNPELRRQAAQLVEVHGLLGVALENESTSGAAAQTISNAIREAERENFVQNVHDKIVVMRRRTWTVPLAAAAAVALLALVVSPWNPLSSQPTLAQLKRVENLDWGDYPARELEANFAAGDSITFTEGLAELDLMGLGRMIIEGPASLDFPEPGHAVVHEGRVVVRVTPAGHGYRLDTPQGTIIDKGTEFGVLIAEDGHVETHVFDGEIEVVEDEGHTVTLTENDARRLDPKGGEVIPVDSGQFYSSLPPLRTSRSKFIHWPLDDGNGRTASVNSNGLGNEDSNLTLLGALNSEPPGWVGGVFGGALNFNGKGSYTESSYRGIPDGEPRTVCCWVKAPSILFPKRATVSSPGDTTLPPTPELPGKSRSIPLSETVLSVACASASWKVRLWVRPIFATGNGTTWLLSSTKATTPTSALMSFSTSTVALSKFPAAPSTKCAPTSTNPATASGWAET